MENKFVLQGVFNETENASVSIGLYNDGKVEVTLGDDKYNDFVGKILNKMSAPNNIDVIYSDSVLQDSSGRKVRFNTRAIFLITKADDRYYFYIQKFAANSTDKIDLSNINIYLSELQELDKDSFFASLAKQEGLKNTANKLNNFFEKHELNKNLKDKLVDNKNSKSNNKL